MRTVLIILTQANLSHLHVNESLTAAMVFSTFGIKIKVLLQDSALSLLNTEVIFDQNHYSFKPASNLLESFEFYDLSPILIDTKDQNHQFVKNSQQEIEFITFDAQFIHSFHHILYW